MRHVNRYLLCWFSFLVAALGCGRAAEWPDAGPLVDAFPLTLTPGHRIEALGPCFNFEQEESRKTWAITPLLSRVWDPATDYNEVDFAYPLVTYRRFGTEYRWQALQALSFAGSQDLRQNGSTRFTLFPLYFQQRSADSNQNYTAVVPFYGHLQNRLFRDEISFVLFPIYGRSRKKDVVTDNYLYPLFHLRHGEALRGWQFWPLAGHEHRDPTTQTNGFGDTELIGGHDDRFVLWPFFLQHQSGIGTGNPEREKALIPFYNSLRSPNRDSTTFLWPFFSHITDREKQYREWEAPWPLIVFARGEGKTTSRVWPFYSRAQNTNLESKFILWPVYRYSRAHAEALDRERTRILFFLYSDTIQKNAETGEARRRMDLWPLFTHQRDYSGKSRLQVFAPLEPFLPASPAIERNYSPLWSAWRAESNPRTQTTSQSLLWNLYRRDATPQSRKWSLLFGLCQYQSGPEGKRLRLLYLPVIQTRSADPPASK